MTGGTGTDGAPGVVAGVLVTLIVAAALLPWWIGARTARRRAAGLSSGAGRDDAGAPSGAEGPPGGIELVVVLAMVGAACRSGASVPRALDAVGLAIGGADGDALSRAGRSLVLGAPWARAWGAHEDAWAGRLAVVRDALAPTWERGSPPGPALAAAADAVRADSRAAARTAAGRLGVRLVVPLGLCYLPAFVLVGLVPVLLSYGLGMLH